MVTWSMPGAPRLRRTNSHARSSTSLRETLSYSAWNRRPGSALAARYSACCKARTGSSTSDPDAVGLATRALTGPSLSRSAHRRSSGPSLTGGCVVRSAQPVLRPPPTPTRPAPTSRRAPVIGRHASGSTTPQPAGPGRASPVPAVTIRTFRTPYAGESLAAAIQDLHRFHGLRRDSRGSALPCSRLTAGMSTARQVSRHATDHPVAPPNGAFDAGLRPGPFPDRAASLLPGLLAATRTGLTPASDDELPTDDQSLHVIDLQSPGRTEQHIQPSQPDGVDGEEVAGEDAGRLLAQERPPGRGRRSRRRVQPVAAQRGADRGCRDPDAEPEQLALMRW